jgi:DNA-binding response OmpR family regulator
MKTPKPRIAIVEDDADQRHSIEEFLLDAGYPVWGVGSAEAFYRQFMVSPVDVVILDIGLPGEDGLAVAKLLQGKPQVAIIILSARDSLVDRLSGLRSGADCYLIKPVNLLELAANIDAVGKRLVLHSEASAQPITTVKENSSAHWHLATKDWVLTAPGGSLLHLTTHEFTLLNGLIRAQGKVVSKLDREFKFEVQLYE